MVYLPLKCLLLIPPEPRSLLKSSRLKLHLLHTQICVGLPKAVLQTNSQIISQTTSTLSKLWNSHVSRMPPSYWILPSYHIEVYLYKFSAQLTLEEIIKTGLMLGLLQAPMCKWLCTPLCEEIFEFFFNFKFYILLVRPFGKWLINALLFGCYGISILNDRSFIARDFINHFYDSLMLISFLFLNAQEFMYHFIQKGKKNIIGKREQCAASPEPPIGLRHYKKKKHKTSPK